MGEPAGVGPDCILQAAHALAGRSDGPDLVVFGDPELFESRARTLQLDLPVVGAQHMDDALAQRTNALKVVKVGTVPDTPGTLDPATGACTIAAIKAALDAVRSQACDGLVTAPIHKSNLYATGFAFPGHTEFLEAYARAHFSADAQAVMMLAGPELRTVPVTVHMPLDAVAGSLTTERIVDVGKRTAHDLVHRFGIARPHLVIAGLNPHAGEGGALGQEDDAIIKPAVEHLQACGIAATGPLPADTLFHPEARARYDAALCMYHDQALIPVKALDFHNTVNVTLGLPFVRTSPDHGTALTLAGTGQASPASMLAAIEMAARMSARASLAA